MIVTNSSLQEISEGESLYLVCSAVGVPTPSLQWLHNGREVDRTLLSFGSIDGHNFIGIEIRFQSRQDRIEGNYTCLAANAVGSVSYCYIVFVNSIITSVTVSSPVSTRESNVTFECFGRGSSESENIYQWWMDGNNNMILGNESTLLVVDIDASSGGNYTCKVRNAGAFETGSASTTLYVAPYILTPLEEHILNANGSNMNINCDAAGFPSPTVNWVDSANIAVSNTSLLEFSPVVFGDEGLYRCVANTEINGIIFTATDKTTFVGRLQITQIIIVIFSIT